MHFVRTLLTVKNPINSQTLPEIELCPKGFVFSRRVRRKAKKY